MLFIFRIIFSKNFVKSFLFFFSNIFVSRKYDVVFYCPQHFNRGDKGENLFFEPLINICKKHGTSYILFEEPSGELESQRNTEAIPFDFIFVLISVIRKFMFFNNFNSIQEKEWFVAKILKKIFFSKFYFNNYITLSNCMFCFFRVLNKDANLYDYQHGIIYSSHWGYFKENQVHELIKLYNVSLLVWGKGFKDLIQRSDVSKYYKDRVFVLGKESVLRDNKILFWNKRIIFSLGLLKDNNSELNEVMVSAILEFLKKHEDFFVKNNIEIFFKKHPRYIGKINNSEILRFNFTKLWDYSLQDCLDNCSLHMTIDSTTTFEAASLSIPTIFLKLDSFHFDIFDKEYDYPIPAQDNEGVIKLLEKYCKDGDAYKSDSRCVKKWYDHFCLNIDENLFLKLLKK